MTQIYIPISTETQDKMIQLYHSHECLWNPSHDVYMDRSAILGTKTHIADELGFANGKSIDIF